MRTKKWDFDPAAVDDNGIADDLPSWFKCMEFEC